jgi:hypothetical protein
MLAKRTKRYLTEIAEACVYEGQDREDSRIAISALKIWNAIWHSGAADLGDARMHGCRVDRQTDVQLSRRTAGA